MKGIDSLSLVLASRGGVGALFISYLDLWTSTESHLPYSPHLPGFFWVLAFSAPVQPPLRIWDSEHSGMHWTL